MAVYQGSLTVKRRPKDGMPGTPGSSGPIPIQKEWVVGDTHRFNDEIKDFIYVRGVSGNTSYWYTRASKGDVVAGSPPVGGANKEGYTRVDWLKTLAVNVLLAEEANLANFVFKDGKLLSIAGTVSGEPATYTGQAGFVHNIILDGQTGAAYFGAEKIMFNPDGSGHLAGGNIRWNSQGRAVFMGGIVSPFVQVNDALIQPNSDNLPCNIYAFYRGMTTSPAYYYTLPCEKELSGLVVRIHNIQGGRSNSMTITASQLNAFYENGTVKSNLDLGFGHAIELICVADNVGFHSWDVIRRYQCRPYNN